MISLCAGAAVSDTAGDSLYGDPHSQNNYKSLYLPMLIPLSSVDTHTLRCAQNSSVGNAAMVGLCCNPQS